MLRYNVSLFSSKVQGRSNIRKEKMCVTKSHYVNSETGVERVLACDKYTTKHRFNLTALPTNLCHANIFYIPKKNAPKSLYYHEVLMRMVKKYYTQN
jgi:hypothetical protein